MNAQPLRRHPGLRRGEHPGMSVLTVPRPGAAGQAFGCSQALP
jgi:hypothetical protein